MAECNMKKYLTLLLLLSLASIAVYSQSIGVTVIAVPVGANVTMDSYVWNITLANDGVTSYQNDHQGIMTVKSGSSANYRVDFSSQNLGYVKQGSSYQIPYYVYVTQLTTGHVGIIGTPAITLGYVQLTSTQSIQFNKKTPTGGIQFYVGFKITATAGDFFESGAYTDNMSITFTAL